MFMFPYFLDSCIPTYLPLDIFESWGSEKRQREIHRPVEDRGKRDGFAANVEWYDFWWIYPSNRAIQ